MIEVTPKKDESIDVALRKLKKKLDRDNVLREYRRRRYYTKPSAKKRQKNKEAKFRAYLRSRDEDN
jgi:small subunit ribosomal protein S21|tara:strand:+ start:279 stop:476 length:198 start_codon:yes stop_codon:yes gene_type:complete